MSTGFDGGDNHQIEVSWPGTAFTTNKDNMMFFVWRPLTNKPSGIFKMTPEVASSNPFGTAVWAHFRDNTFNSQTGVAPTNPTSSYGPTDGWRCEGFTTRFTNPNLEIWHHCRFYDEGVWYHRLLNATANIWNGSETALASLIGGYTAGEITNGYIGAIGVWNNKPNSNLGLETMHEGLYRWADASWLMSLENMDAVTPTFDPLGLGITITYSPGLTHVADDPVGWSYSFDPPAPTSGTLWARQGGVLISSTLSGMARVGGTAFPFGP